MPIAPTLILGLGGTGSNIIEKVHDKVNESSSGQSERIAFVAFDTDINELADIKRRSPDIYPVQTSTRSTVGEYLNINTNARDNWFPVNEMLNRKTLTEGAAQVRAISRLAFDTTLKAGNLEPLHKAIDQLFRIDKDQEEQALRVIIVSSLAGGTGSGLILPVAMYLSNYLKGHFPKAKAITRGFFVQPDVFFSVIPGKEEQKNLQVNAYATVRELDAFLMKGDNTLPPQYSDLVFEFPRVGAEGVEPISAMPYDFCFLFDANNTAGGGLDSFESYKDHAATCIYTLSIGPMSKRSNSSEDNVLREVIKNDGRNRYAGAGASRLFYNWRHVRDFVAYTWAQQALSSQWLTFDDKLKGQREALQKKREMGFQVREFDTCGEFIKTVGAAADNKEAFAKSIQNQCLSFDEDGLQRTGDQWSNYLGQLDAYVKRTCVTPGDEREKRNCLNKVNALRETKDREEYVAAFYDVKKYHDLAERRAEEVSGVIGYTLFHSDGESITKDRFDHQLETYLREKVTGNFIHPVSARYFLYNTLEGLKQAKHQAEIELEKVRQYYASFERNAFDDPGTDDTETPEEFINRKVSLRSKLSRKPGADLTDLTDKLVLYVTKVDALREGIVKVKVFEEAIGYVEGISKAFEDFFRDLDSNLRGLRLEIDLHRTKYDGLKGSTTRYVLADSESLDSVARSMPYVGNVINVDPELAERIYLKVRQYHMLADEKDPGHFRDLYRKEILGYFREQVDEKYGNLLQIDVIDALVREFRAHGTDIDEDNIDHHVRQEIDKVKRLASPFLEQPLGEERHPIFACAFNPKLARDDDPRRKALVAEHLGNYGGGRDSDLSIQEILFYNAIYGIRARDLSKYAPERLNATDKRPAGAYFSAYYQLVSGIKPSVDETKVITPHVDRRWHTIAAMPDLDEGHQDAQLANIHGALLSGIALKSIIWEPVYGDEHLYRYEPLDSNPQDFIVTNGTPCDQFYEVLDALTINPVAVSELNAVADHAFANYLETDRATNFKDSPFARALESGLALGQLRRTIPEFAHRKATVFDLASFYAMSVPKDQYSEELLRKLVHNMLMYIKEQVDRVEDPGEAVTVLETLYRSQFDTYRRNHPLFVEHMGEPFVRRIITILRPFGSLTDNLRMRELSGQVQEYVRELRGE